MDTAAALVRDAGFDPVIVGALGRGEADETHARVALAVGLAAGDGAGEALLAVETEACRQDHVAGPVAGQCRP